MSRSILFSFSLLLLFTGLASAQTPAPKDVDIAAPVGAKLRATFFAASNIAASKPGPGVLLLHMCNTARKSWEPVALGLSRSGINTLTIDNRGFGESGGPRFEGGTPEVRQQLNEKWPATLRPPINFWFRSRMSIRVELLWAAEVAVSAMQSSWPRVIPR